MTLPVANFLIENVFWILGDPTDDSQCIGAVNWVNGFETCPPSWPLCHRRLTLLCSLHDVHSHWSPNRFGPSFSSPIIDMAEFKAIITASFDDICFHVALNNIRALHPARFAPPSSEDNKTTRRSPLSFLCEVKSHPTSLLVPQSRPDSATPSRSFVPTLVPARQPTPAPFAPSLSCNLFTRAFGRNPHTSHVPDLELKSSFFDDDDDEDNVDVNRRFFSSTHRISSGPARSNSRLSAFAPAPTLFSLSVFASRKT